MSNLFLWAALAAIAATLLCLALGVAAMGMGGMGGAGEKSRAADWSHYLMRARVVCQWFAVGLLLLAAIAGQA